MNDDDDGANNKSTWPPPPILYELYDSESIMNNPVLLKPPEPPKSTETFVKFGQSICDDMLIPELAADIEKRFDGDDIYSIDITKELKRLNRTTFRLYIELLDCLVNDAKEVERIVAEIRTVLFNMSYIINIIRPYQARCSIIEVLKRQIENRTQKAEYIEECVKKTQLFITQHNNNNNSNTNNSDHIEIDNDDDIIQSSSLKQQLDAIPLNL